MVLMALLSVPQVFGVCLGAPRGQDWALKGRFHRLNSAKLALLWGQVPAKLSPSTRAASIEPLFQLEHAHIYFKYRLTNTVS